MRQETPSIAASLTLPQPTFAFAGVAGGDRPPWGAKCRAATVSMNSPDVARVETTQAPRLEPALSTREKQSHTAFVPPYERFRWSRETENAARLVTAARCASVQQ